MDMSRVDKVMADYLRWVQALTPGLVKGVYITGSAALGDYYPAKSDIDLVAIVNEMPGRSSLRQLEKIHNRIERDHDHPKLNGYYLTEQGIKENGLTFPSFFRNKMYAQRPLELNKILLYELKNFSRHVYGPPIEYYSIEVIQEDVIRQLHDNINSYWERWVARHSRAGVNMALLICFPRLTEWGILGVLRQLYTLETGKITSKLNAGKYYVDKLPDKYRGIISSAIRIRCMDKTEIRPSIKRARQTVECMSFIISEFNRLYVARS